MVRAGVIGVGRWGANVLRALGSLHGVSIAAVCDADAIRLDQVTQLGASVRKVAEADSVFRDESLDCVAICTPLSTHFELAQQALLAGKHVFVEKPLASSSEECRELIALARDNERTLFVGHTFKYHPGIQAAKVLIESHQLGSILAIEARRVNLGPVRTDASALWDLASHDLAVFHYWLGESPSHVSAFSLSTIRGSVPDLASGVFEFESGPIAHVYATWLRPPKIREISVIGDRKVLVWNDGPSMDPIRVYDRKQNELGDTAHAPVSAGELEQGHYETLEVPPLEPLARECEEFVRCVRTGARPLTDGVDGLRVVLALEAADRSISQGARRVEVSRVDGLS